MENLAKLLTDHVNGATFISLTLETEPKLNKTFRDENDVRQPNPHFGRITKVTERMNVMVYQNKTTNAYDNMVRNRLVAEGKDPDSFELGERAFGTRIPNTCFVEHKGQYYIEVIALHPGTTTYLLDGKPIAKSDIIGLAATSDPEQGGLDKKVIVRTPKVENIRSIAINKQHYHNLYFDISEI
jgi:hypothetical protein